MCEVRPPACAGSSAGAAARDRFSSAPANEVFRIRPISSRNHGTALDRTAFFENCRHLKSITATVCCFSLVSKLAFKLWHNNALIEVILARPKVCHCKRVGLYYSSIGRLFLSLPVHELAAVPAAARCPGLGRRHAPGAASGRPPSLPRPPREQQQAERSSVIRKSGGRQ